MLDISRPSALVDVSIFIGINSLKSFVVTEGASENVSIEKSELS